MRRSMLVAALLLLVSCGDTAETTVAPTVPKRGADDPVAAVEVWLDAVTLGDLPEIDRHVPERQLLLMLGLENGLSYGAIAGLDRAGIDDEVRAEYWQSFSSEFTEFAGDPPGALEVIDSADLEVAGRRYAAVETSFPTSIDSTEILVAETGGRWEIDLMATFGPDLVRPLRDLLASLTADEDSALVRDMLADVVPSLRAALLRPGAADLPVEFVLETEALIQLLVPRAP